MLFAKQSISKQRRKIVWASILLVLTGVIIGVICGVLIPRRRNDNNNVQSGGFDESSTTSWPTTSLNTSSPTGSGATTAPPAVGVQNSNNQTSSSPTVTPTVASSPAPTAAPTPAPTVNVTFRPGILSGWEAGLNLSQGLTARIIAETDEMVPYHNGSNSSIPFHGLPDFGATFWDTSPTNTGGWIYVSNSEMPDKGEGGVGAIKFDKDGNVLEYRMLLTDTTMNCGGGRTPWDTWISCEEYLSEGQIYQVHPNGARPPERLTMGLDGDRFESFAYDNRNLSQPYFFATVDKPYGALRRWTPAYAPDWTTDPWSMLHGPGNLTYLHLTPFHDDNDTSSGTFTWITNRSKAKKNAYQHFPETEGIDRVDSILYFVSKPRKVLYMLNLDTMTFTRESTVFGLFEGAADQIQRIFAADTNNDGDPILYFTEERDGGTSAGIHGRNFLGQYFTILEGPRTLWRSESTGLAFSPDGRHLYFAFQKHGVVFDVTRNDGLAFHGRSLDVHYHAVDIRNSLRF